MIFPQWQLQLVSLIVSFIYIYIPRKKNLTKKLGSFYNTHSFYKFGTHLIVIIKYDVVVIICDGSAIQCDAGTF
jgi:hypothetical protein